MNTIYNNYILQLNLEFKMLSNETFNRIEDQSREDMKKENTDLIGFLEKLSKETVFAIINQGAMGIEPIVYLVSNSVKNLVSICQDITSKL